MDVTPKIHHTSITHSCETPHSSCNEPKQPLSDDDTANIVQFDKQQNITYLPISTSPTLKRKRHMYYMLLDFEKLTLDGLIDTGALAMTQKKKLAHCRISKLLWPMGNSKYQSAQ